MIASIWWLAAAMCIVAAIVGLAVRNSRHKFETPPVTTGRSLEAVGWMVLGTRIAQLLSNEWVGDPLVGLAVGMTAFGVAVKYLAKLTPIGVR